MATLAIELTNRCNLHCYHCFSGRHGGRTDFPLAILPAILAEAKSLGFRRVGFTGGEVTVYPHFATVLEMTCAAGYSFGFNTNGWNFATTYGQILPYRTQLEVITFSLDGATAATHDQLRGNGSFRRVLQAMSVCVVQALPFTINMVVTAHNCHELEAMVTLAANLGAQRLRFGHLMPAPLTTDQGYDLSLSARRTVEAEIWAYQRTAALPVDFAPGYYTERLFPCNPLHSQEVNIDCYGNLTKCCHLSGHGPGAGTADIIGDLAVMGFTTAYAMLLAENQRFHQRKHERVVSGEWQETDHFPCWYCANHYRKLDWLKSRTAHPWQKHIWGETETPINLI